jgi:hypothetical protein
MRIIDKIGPLGTGVIYWGVPMTIFTVIVVHLEALVRLFGSYGGAYALLGIAVVLMIVFRLLRSRISKRTAVVAGMIGWLVSISFAFWWYCWGPGAFGRSHF